MHRPTRGLAALLLACSAALAAFAADTPEPAPKDKLTEARQQIAAKQWPAALDALRRVNDGSSADWHNLMGYTLRKGATPDLDAAGQHYDEALRINPKHRGALEYSGELFLMKGDLAGAERRLAALDKVCTLPCEEYTDLKKAVQKYKAAGRYTAD